MWFLTVVSLIKSCVVSRMKEPYFTLVLLLASVGMRGESAIALKPSDLDGENVLHVRRVIYDGHEETLNDEEQEEFPWTL